MQQADRGFARLRKNSVEYGTTNECYNNLVVQ